MNSRLQKARIEVQGTSIRVLRHGDRDYISLTDMLKAKDGDFFISDWLRNRNTVEFLGVWEKIYNPDFNYGEFATIKSQAGLNSYKISVADWTLKTNAIGLQAKAGRYGGTYAHTDIAFEFGMWISPEFKIYLIREFQRLKEQEQKKLSSPWNVNRALAKINYRIHTDAIQNHFIPPLLNSKQIASIYATEADLLNMALFACTAKEWRKANPQLEGNMRDYATIEQLLVLANLESMNAELIHMNLTSEQRLAKLNDMAIRQLKILIQNTISFNPEPPSPKEKSKYLDIPLKEPEND